MTESHQQQDLQDSAHSWVFQNIIHICFSSSSGTYSQRVLNWLQSSTVNNRWQYTYVTTHSVRDVCGTMGLLKGEGQACFAVGFLIGRKRNVPNIAPCSKTERHSTYLSAHLNLSAVYCRHITGACNGTVHHHTYNTASHSLQIMNCTVPVLVQHWHCVRPLA